VTDLLNLAMPLIRYRIGDVAVPMAGTCPCGRGLPRLEGLQGRVTDFLVGTDGQVVSGTMLSLLIVAKRPGLGQVQIWQDTRGRVLFKIVKRDSNSPTAEDLEFLGARTRFYLGENVKIEHEFVDSLPTQVSGKYLFCHSSAACDFVDLHSRNGMSAKTHEQSPSIGTAGSDSRP
jgi:phenylacetate-CoA ligase